MALGFYFHISSRTDFINGIQSGFGILLSHFFQDRLYKWNTKWLWDFSFTFSSRKDFINGIQSGFGILLSHFFQDRLYKWNTHLYTCSKNMHLEAGFYFNNILCVSFLTLKEIERFK